MYTFFTTMNGIRSAATNASSTFNNNQATIIGQDDHNLVIRKDPLISVVTNRGGNASTSSLVITNTGISTPTELIDVVSCATYTTDNKGAFTASIKSGLPAVFIPSSQKGSLCGTTTAATTGGSDNKASAGFREATYITSLMAILLPAVAFCLF